MKTETIIFDTIAPHPEPFRIDALLADIESVIKRHVILPDHAAAALALWVLHTYTFELRDTVAYVAIESPEKRCGKTTLLSVLAAMACKSLIASNITVAALFRAIHTCSPTLFIDEADTFLAGNSVMRGIINSGNTRRTAYVLRLAASKKNPLPSDPRASAGVPVIELPSEDSSFKTQNSTFSNDTGLKKFSCWCPKVIAMIGEVPDTIADRSIVVKMARKLTTETCAPFAELDTTLIRAKCARFALDCRQAIAIHPKISTPGLNDRAADTFDPLFVIARLAGDEWENKLRAAALALSATADTENSGSGLILDILDLFVQTGSEKMFTRDLVTRLRDANMSHGSKYSSIDDYQISKTLRQYGIKPVQIRIGREVHRGYIGDDFHEARERYVSQADIKARVEEIQHKRQLYAEARAHAQKEAELQQQLLEKVRSDKKFTPESVAMLHELNNLSKTDSPFPKTTNGQGR